MNQPKRCFKKHHLVSSIVSIIEGLFRNASSGPTPFLQSEVLAAGSGTCVNKLTAEAGDAKVREFWIQSTAHILMCMGTGFL